MTELQPRIFVSSVMKGYQNFRRAASAAIRRAGCNPVLAEMFPAHSSSPRSACLDGVESADALVLLLGSRFGWKTPSGRSATEEEYQHACRKQIPIMVFVQKGGTTEPEQQRFIEEVEDYVHGHFRKSFETPNDLNRLLTEAILSANLGAASRETHLANERVHEALNQRPPDTQNAVWMTTVWTTLRNEHVVDPLELSDDIFGRQVLRQGHECEPPLFSYKSSKQSDVTVSRLRIIESPSWDQTQDGADTIATIYSNGTISVQQNVNIAEDSSIASSSFDIERLFVLSPKCVNECLRSAWSFASDWWHWKDRFVRHSSLLYNVGFYDIGERSFKEVGSHGRNSGVTIPPRCPHNPLIIFDQPQQISRTAIDIWNTEISRIHRMIELRFREWADNVW